MPRYKTSRRKDLAGKRFGEWSVLSFMEAKSNGSYYLCECSCGKRRTVHGGELTTGRSKSCGHLGASHVHGHAKRGRKGKAYRTWAGMRSRCNNEKQPAYPNYGGRGIKVCERWADYEAFLADMGEPPPGTTLDRIDNDGPYSPGNCRWATIEEQRRNSRRTINVTIGGVTKCLSDWSKERGLSYGAVYARIKRGWNPIEALETKVARSNGRTEKKTGSD